MPFFLCNVFFFFFNWISWLVCILGTEGAGNLGKIQAGHTVQGTLWSINLFAMNVSRPPPLFHRDIGPKKGWERSQIFRYGLPEDFFKYKAKRLLAPDTLSLFLPVILSPLLVEWFLELHFATKNKNVASKVILAVRPPLWFFALYSKNVRQPIP